MFPLYIFKNTLPKVETYSHFVKQSNLFINKSLFEVNQYRLDILP
jgi:hypothetical protein